MKKTKKSVAERSARKKELVDALLRQVVGGESSDDSSYEDDSIDDGTGVVIVCGSIGSCW